ncbi:Hypothetical predicted protein [Xyrichtys novacula]|uniref:Uncharacterized protein n=1 Tax=Xyrichtys novacula TaxID=13765 RepID=A0AAV1GZP3_XYRNO|nr:Hypothetical predicted protein [Xyrichtys novacula]
MAGRFGCSAVNTRLVCGSEIPAENEADDCSEIESRFPSRCAHANLGKTASSLGKRRITVEGMAVCLKGISDWWVQTKEAQYLAACWLTASLDFPTQRRLSSVQCDSPSPLIPRHDQSTLRRLMDDL